jgi:hypothetical protein
MNQINRVSDEKLVRLIPFLPKGYYGSNTSYTLWEYTISTPCGNDIILTRSKDKRYWYYAASTIASEII